MMGRQVKGDTDLGKRYEDFLGDTVCYTSISAKGYSLIRL